MEMTTNNKPSNKMNKEERNMLNYLSNNKPSEPVSEMKFKEFWIGAIESDCTFELRLSKEHAEKGQWYDAYNAFRFDPEVIYHVIEYSALEKERAKVKEIQAKYDEFLSYLHKVLIMPHNKEVSKRIIELEKELNTLKNREP